MSAPDPAGEAGGPAGGARILLIEDDPLNASFFRAVLRHDGHAVALETSGILGRARALAESFDLVLCDIDLPGVNGIEICEALRAAGFRGGVIALTVHVRSDLAAGAGTLGFDDWLEKPITPAALRAAVRAHRP